MNQTALETHYYEMVIIKILHNCKTAVKFSRSFPVGLYFHTSTTDVLLVCLYFSVLTFSSSFIPGNAQYLLVRLCQFLVVFYFFSFFLLALLLLQTFSALDQSGTDALSGSHTQLDTSLCERWYVTASVLFSQTPH
jgi:hypothetical protein